MLYVYILYILPTYPLLLSPHGGPYIYIFVKYFAYIYRSEGFALTGYDIPGCVEDGAWMLWGNSSVAVVAAAILTHPGWGGGRRDFGFSRNQITKNAPPGAFL